MGRVFWQVSVAGLLWLALAVHATAAATDAGYGADDWQARRLLDPSEHQRRQEERGQVFIYDGLESGMVQQAMDQNFDRIQNMMFTRIHHLPPTASGPVTVEDDGCGD